VVLSRRALLLRGGNGRPSHRVIGRLALLAAIIVLLSSPSAATDLYVATNGSDVGNCQVEASPCRTGQYAVNQTPLAGGAVINFADGAYSGPISVSYWKIVNLRGNCANLDNIISVSLRSRASPAAADRV
jgi:hypothetical protein